MYKMDRLHVKFPKIWGNAPKLDCALGWAYTASALSSFGYSGREGKDKSKGSQTAILRRGYSVTPHSNPHSEPLEIDEWRS